MFKNFSLKNKLICICLGLATITLAAGGIGLFALQNVNTKHEHVSSINLPNMVNLSTMQSSSRAVRGKIALLALPDITKEQYAETVKEALEAIQEFESADRKYNLAPFAKGEMEVYEPLIQEWRIFKNLAEKCLSFPKIPTKESRIKIADILTKNLITTSKKFNKKINALIAFQENQSLLWVEAAHTSSAWANNLLIVTVLGSFFAAIGFGIAFSASLSRQLQDLARKLGTGAIEVTAASTQISESCTDLSAATNQQAAALQQTVASIDEVSAMVNKNADNANRSTQVTHSSQKAAIRGKIVIGEMIESIQEIDRSNHSIVQQIEKSNHNISEIVKVITEIGTKTKVINDIVFQTKLLSFNASVEAARAGEHGKGFAVVAEEVGSLAQMSGNAAKEISDMLDSSIRKVESIVNETRIRVEGLTTSSNQKVKAGAETAQRCSDVLEEIVINVSEATQRVGEIATASHEQAQGVQEITKAMGQLDQGTHQTASAAQQTATATGQLNHQAKLLNRLVVELEQTINGRKNKVIKKDILAKVIDLKRPQRKKITPPIKPVSTHSPSTPVPSEDDPRFKES